MTRGVLALAAAGGLVTLLAVVVAGAPRARSLDVFVLFLGALVIAWLLERTWRLSGAGRPSTFERALRRAPPSEPTRPAGLQQVERIVVLAAENAFDLHHRLEPRLRAIAAHRLASRRGLGLDSEEARALLGEELMELLRSGPARPGDRFAPGMPLARQRAALERLEEI